MNPSSDASAEVDAGDVQPGERAGGWTSTGSRFTFWIIAGTAPFMLCIGWFWYGLTFFEEMTEQGKALAAGDTMAGSGLLMGGIPLVLAHLFLLVTLLVIGATTHSRPVVGIVLAVVMVAAASGLGIAVNELLWTGNLFTMSAEHFQCCVIEPP